MRGPAVKPVVIAAGGTGGHFFPAEALAAELVARGQRVALMTDARSRGLDSPVFAGRERFVLPRRRHRRARRAARGAVRSLALAVGTVQARRILARLDAAAVVGFGGYPVGRAGARRTRCCGGRPPVVLHEQNAVLGRANRFLARHADRLALSFAATALVPRRHAHGGDRQSGAPGDRRAGRRRLRAARRDGSVRLLVLGGSLGARVFSDVVPDGARRAAAGTARRDCASCSSAGRRTWRACARPMPRSGIAAELAPFFADVASRLAAAHLVIARAGASTVAELAVAGRPAILVPLPGAIDDHQSANARALVAAGAAEAIAQAAFTPTRLAAALAAWLGDPARLAAAAAATRGVARADAAARLADLVESIMKREPVGVNAGPGGGGARA